MREEFSEEELRHLSKLCRIHCTDEEIQELAGNLQKIVGHIEKLMSLDIDIPPVSISLPPTPLREDLPTRVLPREEFLMNVKEHSRGMVKVPKVFS